MFPAKTKKTNIRTQLNKMNITNICCADTLCPSQSFKYHFSIQEYGSRNVNFQGTSTRWLSPLLQCNYFPLRASQIKFTWKYKSIHVTLSQFFYIKSSISQVIPFLLSPFITFIAGLANIEVLIPSSSEFNLFQSPLTSPQMDKK